MQHASAKKSASSEDAIALLISDHKKVKQLFTNFAKWQTDGGDEKSALVEQICNELKIHATIEEEIFYPAVREAIENPDLMDEALVEHAAAKNLIKQLENMSPDDDLYDAKVTVLGEQIAHHVREEEGEMFPLVKKADVDTEALGAKMIKRKMVLVKEMGLADAEVGILQMKKAANQG